MTGQENAEGEVIKFIIELGQECSAMCANDSEMYVLRELIEDIYKGKRTPEDAKKIAIEIRDSKMSYH